MAEMHWEARRKQTVLDRAFDVQDKWKTKFMMSATTSPAPSFESIGSHLDRASLPPSRRQITDDEMREKVRTDHLRSYSAKLPNRYSSLNYTQQW
ncbi:unnamed protein product [Clavelina lepadiformis]|uniref:Uncharacterized protein n=1 Tax=Clavelina lepadiformis TaxID=159417 RepID=A0ABP0F629_CLALP